MQIAVAKDVALTPQSLAAWTSHVVKSLVSAS
jgi:hypothetical protein